MRVTALYERPREEPVPLPLLVSMKKGHLSRDGESFEVSLLSRLGMWSSTHVSMASSAGGPGEIGCFARGRKSKEGGLCRQTKSGASWSELLTSRKHVPDRVRQPAGDVDLGDLGAALLAEPALGALVALRVGGVAQRVHRRLQQRPAQIGGPVLGERAAAVLLARLVDARAESRVAGELLRAREAGDLADLGGDRKRQDPPDPGHREQQRDVGMVGVPRP